MPAVTVEDPTRLPRITLSTGGTTPAAKDRPVKGVSTAPRGYEGEGFPVRRAFAGADLADLDPFIHLDQIGEVEYAPGEPKGTPWHPHRGFETVTYMMDGVLQHRDSNGGGGLISNGDTQWMTAGRGILHIETPPEYVVKAGGWFHGLQLWVNLPAKEKWVPPRYQDLNRDEVVLLTNSDASALVRLIAGDLGGHEGPGSTHTPITLVHASVTPRAELTLPWPRGFNALAYVLSGRGTAGAEGVPVRMGQLAVFGAGDRITLKADKTQESRSPDLELLLLGGRPIREPVAWMGPFVMNTEEEIHEAIADFRAGRLGEVPAVHGAPKDLVMQTDSSLD